MMHGYLIRVAVTRSGKATSALSLGSQWYGTLSDSSTTHILKNILVNWRGCRRCKKEMPGVIQGLRKMLCYGILSIFLAYQKRRLRDDLSSELSASTAGKH